MNSRLSLLFVIAAKLNKVAFGRHGFSHQVDLIFDVTLRLKVELMRERSL